MDELTFRDDFILALECLKSDKSIIIDSVTKVAIYYKQFAPTIVNIILSKSRTCRSHDEVYYLMLLMVNILALSNDSSFYICCDKDNHFVSAFIECYKDIPALHNKFKDLIRKALTSGISASLFRDINDQIQSIDREIEISARKKLRSLPVLYLKDKPLDESQKSIVESFYRRDTYKHESESVIKKNREWYVDSSDFEKNPSELIPETIPAEQGLPITCSICKNKINPEYNKILNSWCFKNVKLSGKDINHFECFVASVSNKSQVTHITDEAKFSPINLPHCASSTCFLDKDVVISFLHNTEKSTVDLFSFSLLNMSSNPTISLDLSSQMAPKSIHKVLSLVVTSTHYYLGLWAKFNFPIIKVSKSNLNDVTVVNNGDCILFNKVYKDTVFYFDKNSNQLVSYTPEKGSVSVDTADLLQDEPLDIATDKNGRLWIVSESSTIRIDANLPVDDPEYCITAFSFELERPNCVYIDKEGVQGLLAYETCQKDDASAKKFAFLDIMNVDMVELISDESYMASSPPQSLFIHGNNLFAWTGSEWLVCNIPDEINTL